MVTSIGGARIDGGRIIGGGGGGHQEGDISSADGFESQWAIPLVNQPNRYPTDSATSSDQSLLILDECIFDACRRSTS